MMIFSSYVFDNLSSNTIKLNSFSYMLIEKLRKASTKAVFFSSLVYPTTRLINGCIYAAVGIVGDIVLDDALEIEVDVGEFTKRGSAVDEAELLYVSTGISDSLLSKVTIIGENCRIKRSADGKTLKVAKSNGLVLFVR